LPTDAEWEHACRAGTNTTYYTGDSEADLDRAGWYDRWYDKNSKDTTHPVGQKTPNAWGVHDMHGNVFEWCADWCENYGAEAVTDPQGPTQCADRVLRGGSWFSLPGNCRSARRIRGTPDFRGDIDFGFRVVISARAP
jgi:formylglycine-generating enzyme required for sulfatase activity